MLKARELAAAAAAVAAAAVVPVDSSLLVPSLQKSCFERALPRAIVAVRGEEERRRVKREKELEREKETNILVQ